MKNIELSKEKLNLVSGVLSLTFQIKKNKNDLIH